MSIRSYPARLLLLTTILSALTMMFCVLLATWLNTAQSSTAEILRENIGSRREADSLEESLTLLMEMHKNRDREVEPVHQRVLFHLKGLETLADKLREQELTAQLERRFGDYLAAWSRDKRPAYEDQTLDGLRDCMALCQQLVTYNSLQIDDSQEDHKRALSRMTWGLIVVGGVGSLSGMLLGYGLARSLRRSIHEFLVRVQGATDLLGAQTSSVVIVPDGDPLDVGGHELLQRVELVVARLQEKEREVQQSERLAMLGQLAAGVAHEIRNPLTSAILLLETSRKDPTAGGLTEEDLDLIEAELHRIEASLQTLIDYARPAQLARAEMDLVGLIGEVLQLCRGRFSQQKIESKTVVPASPVLVLGDREQLRQVLLNLILNALDVMPFRGRLTVSVTRDAADGSVSVSVADTGPGISARMLPRLFQAFATGKDTGLGLGLVVSRRIVSEHGGEISGENPPEGGARFTIRLPRESVVARDTPERERDTPERERGTLERV